MPIGGGDSWSNCMAAIADVDSAEPATCISGLVQLGLKKPCDCPAFGTTCTPRMPQGATMASAEGPCAAYYEYERSVPSDPAE